jgi:hypothetical protein
MKETFAQQDVQQAAPFLPAKSEREHYESRPSQGFPLNRSLRRKVFPGNRLLTICKVISPLV